MNIQVLRHLSWSLQRRDFRVIVCYDYMKNLKQESAFETLLATFGKQTPSRAVESKWHREFERGRARLWMETRAGGPVTAATVENTQTVSDLIKNNARLTTLSCEGPDQEQCKTHHFKLWGPCSRTMQDSPLKLWGPWSRTMQDSPLKLWGPCSRTMQDSPL